MQSRRQFLCTAVRAAAGTTVTLVLTPLVGCGSDDTPAPTTSTNPTVPPSCDGISGVSTNVLAHTHEICVPRGDLDSPPVAGKSYLTSAASTNGHTHGVELSFTQLVALRANQTVTVTTTVAESHTHDFGLRSASTGVAVPTQPGY